MKRELNLLMDDFMKTTILPPSGIQFKFADGLLIQQKPYTGRTESGAILVPLSGFSSVESAMVSNSYYSGSMSLEYTLTIQLSSSNELIVYCRGGNGGIPPDGTYVSCEVLVRGHWK